jgi:hypothetical protein
MMPLALLIFAAVAVICVLAGELAELPFRRRILGARQSRMLATPQRASLRR